MEAEQEEQILLAEMLEREEQVLGQPPHIQVVEAVAVVDLEVVEVVVHSLLRAGVSVEEAAQEGK